MPSGSLSARGPPRNRMGEGTEVALGDGKKLSTNKRSSMSFGNRFVFVFVCFVCLFCVSGCVLCVFG